MRATTEFHASEAALAAPTQSHPLSSAAMPTPRFASGIGFWIVTVLFCVQMCFTAYAQLRLPQVAAAFIHLGFPSYFRVELSCAKLLGVVLLLAPVPARLKEWAYAGFAIDVGSALVAPPAGGAARGGRAGAPPGGGPTARRRGSGRRLPLSSGRSRTSSGAAWTPGECKSSG